MKRKIFKALFFSVVGLLFLLTLAGFIFQDRIVSFALEGIRSSIRSRIIIGDASLSLVKNFPYASVRLYDVTIISTNDLDKSQLKRLVQADTLIKAKSINVKLNMLDLFANKVSIKQLSIRDGLLTLLVDKNGNDNFHVVRKGSSGVGASAVKFEVNSIRIRDTKVRYINLSKQLTYSSSINSLDAKGRFSYDNFKLSSASELTINQLSVGSITYIKNRHFLLEGKVDSESYKSFIFNDFSITYKSCKIAINGGFSLKNDFYVDLVASGKDLVLKEMNELVPKISKSLDKVNFEGKVNITAKANGFWTRTRYPFIYGEFDVKGGKSELLQDRSIASVNLVGTFSNGRGDVDKAFVRFDSFIVNTNFGDFQGKFTLTNFNRPLVSLSSNFNLFLGKLNDAYRVDSTKVLDGAVIGSVTANGIVSFDSLTFLKLVRLVNNGSFKLSEVSVPLAGSKYMIPSGELSFNPNSANASLSVISNSLTGRVAASASGLYDGLLDQKPFSATINATTKSISFDNLLKINFGINKSSDKKDLNLVNLTLNVKSSSAVFRGVQLANLEAVVEKNGPSIAFSQLKANAFGGKVGLVGKLEPLSSKAIAADFFAVVDSVRIENLFSSFKNFGQATLTSNNIKGVASGEIALRGQYTQSGTIDPKTLDCVASISIVNGQLVRFEPAYKLSRFIDLKELEHIQFANLKNEITIKNGVVTIPAMYVGSSAINLGVIGTHSFSGDYTYRLKLALKDVLFHKARSGLKKQVSQEEFEKNTQLYFKVEGNAKSSKVSYDWSGRGWDLPSGTIAPKVQERHDVQKNSDEPKTKSFKLQWDGEEVAAPKKPASLKTEPLATEKAKSATTEPKKVDEKKKPKFKVEWEE
jgi:hypothetical protein